MTLSRRYQETIAAARPDADAAARMTYLELKTASAGIAADAR